MTREPKIRDLRVTDLRCLAEGCGAGPGERCKENGAEYSSILFHPERVKEHTELVAAGWQWQEVIEHDNRGGR